MQNIDKKEKIIEVKNLTKYYNDGKVETKVLKGINLNIYAGEFVAIMGKSGAGTISQRTCR